MNKKVGIVTFFRGNYGSVLQAYASTEVLKQEGFSPVIIEKRENRISNLIRFAARCVCHPRYIKTFINQRKKTFSGSQMTECDKQLMKGFISKNLTVFRATHTELRQVGINNDYIAFLSGSDQIWGGHLYFIDSARFLRFAPRGKRIAWAPSIGTADIAKYNRRIYKKYISDYEYLSAREETAANIISELTEREVPVLIDPVYLLTRDKWLTFAGKCEHERYVLCYFLDKPNQAAVIQIKQYCEAHNTKVLAFGPWNDFYKELSAEHIHGDPSMFISLIAQANCIFTDSFHGLSFSLILNTPFFVYRRNYLSGIDQSSRVERMLCRVNMTRYLSPESVADESWDFTKSNLIIAEEREKMLEYLRTCLNRCAEAE